MRPESGRAGLVHIIPIILGLLSVSIPPFAQEKPEKAAEGAFGYVSAAAGQEIRRHFDEWTLWKTSQGYTLETTIYLQGRPGTSRAKEVLYLSDRFHIDGFTIYPVDWDPPLVGAYNCHLQPLADTQRLQCDYSIHNKQGGGNIALPEPYVFEVSVNSVNTDSVFDLPFSFGNMVLTAPRDPKRSRTIQLVYLKIFDATDNDPNHVEIVADRTENKKIRFLGREQITVLHQQVNAMKFDFDKTFTIWTAESGMPLAVEHRLHPRRWELTRFQQYQTLVPELK